MSGKIVVVGSFVTDYVADMERFPAAGETVLGREMRVCLGGKGVNQAVAARRMGAAVDMLGMVGRDAAGEAFLRLLQEEGIGASGVVATDAAATGAAQVQVAASQNRICVLPGANRLYRPENLAACRDTILSAALVVTQLETPLTVTEALADMCFEAGVPLLLNPAPAVALSPSLLKKVRFLTPNESELSALSGLPAGSGREVKEAAARLISMGAGCVVATLGSRGAYFTDGAACGFVPGYSVKAVDTVAAGDSFNGALAFGLASGLPLTDCIRLGNAAGALAVTVRGAIPSIPTRAAVDNLLRKKT